MQRVYAKLLVLSLVFGCAQLHEETSTSESQEKWGIDSNSDTALRVGLAALSGERPIIDYQSLLDDGEVIDAGPVTGTQRLRGNLRKALLVLAEYRTDRIRDERIRVQKFLLNRDFPAVRLIGREIDSVLPFQIRADGDIEFARWFDSESNMSVARRFSLLDIPYNAETALQLPPNTVVSIPVDLHASFDVGGQFIQEAFQRSEQLLKPLSVSMNGNVSAVRQGTLMGRGAFRLQFIRLANERVRVRLLSESELNAQARIWSSAGAMVQYLFMPSSKLDRLRAFRRHLEKTGRLVRSVRHLDERMTSLRRQVPDAVRATIDSLPVEFSDSQSDVVERALNRADQALALAQLPGEGLAALDELVGKRTDTALNRVRSIWDERIAPVTERIRRLSSRVYRLDQMVRLEDGLSRQLRLLADYEFDLSDEDARIAFEHAVSGEAVWRGAREIAESWDMENVSFSDFTLANTIATEDQGVIAPRVRRMAAGMADLRERRFSIATRGLGIEIGVDGSFENNRVDITDAEGVESAWHTRAWERGQRTTIFGNARSETFASGAFTGVEDSEISRGGYWFRWRKIYGNGTNTPVANALAHILNDLGPAAMRAGVPGLYQGEHDGKVDAELFVVLNPSAMTALFDSAQVDIILLWQVLGDMMTRYQRPLSLPYAHAPIRPRGLREIDGAEAACEAVARRLGGRYCYSFHDRIFPALQAAQNEETAEARLAFFESFYRVPLGGSSLSTRVLVRYLAELFDALGIDEPFTIKLQIRNADDDSEAASPKLSVGNPLHLTLSRATALEALSD